MPKLTPDKIALLVIRASNDIERNEYCDAGAPYDCLIDFTNRTDTRGRIEVATAIYLRDMRQLRGSRAFDNCFENGDGDAVVAELTRRADADPRLHAAIVADFGGTYPASWRAAADAEPLQLALELA